MFSAELKINGVQIGYLYGYNTGEISKGKSKYKYSYDSPFRLHKEGELWHERNEGLESLVEKIFSSIIENDNSEES